MMLAYCTNTSVQQSRFEVNIQILHSQYSFPSTETSAPNFKTALRCLRLEGNTKVDGVGDLCSVPAFETWPLGDGCEDSNCEMQRDESMYDSQLMVFIAAVRWLCECTGLPCITLIQKIDFVVTCQNNIISPYFGITTIITACTVAQQLRLTSSSFAHMLSWQNSEGVAQPNVKPLHGWWPVYKLS